MPGARVEGRGGAGRSSPTKYLRPLAEAAGRSASEERLGRDALALASLAAGGARILESWVIEAAAFEVAVEHATARRQDVRGLVKLAGTPAGDEACAQAFHDLTHQPLPEPLVFELEAWWRSLDPRPDQGLVVRPSVVAEGTCADDLGRRLPSARVPDALEPLLDAIRHLWASAVSSLAVEGCVEAGLKELAVAVVVQRFVPGSERWLVPAGPEFRGGLRHHVGELVEDRVGAGRLRLSSTASEPPSAPLSELVTRALGPDTAVSFLGEPDADALVVRAIRDALPPREEATVWLELAPRTHATETLEPLSRSLLARLAEGAVHAGLRDLGAPVDEPRQFLGAGRGRTYLSLDAVIEAVRDLPVSCGEDLLLATGCASTELLDALVGRTLAPKRRLREIVQAVALLSRQTPLLLEATERERRLQREARGLGELDVTILPTDGVATTLVHAQEIVQRAVELWARLAAGQALHAAGLRKVLLRAGVAASHGAVASLVSGAGATLGVALTEAVARGVEAVRGDPAARAAVERGAVTLGDLDDGPARGALGQLLSSFGDVADSPFELAMPRWREEPRPLFDLLRAWLARPDASRASVVLACDRVQARADAELARLEAALGRAELGVVRLLVERSRGLARARAAVDRLVLRCLALLRDVVLDADRRLRRIDPSLAPGAAFAATFDHLVAALRTGRPELARLVAMRRAERGVAAPPPPSFRARPPSVAPLLGVDGPLRGQPGSPGVAEGDVPRGSAVHAGELSVVRTLGLADVPAAFLSSGVVSETDGLGSPAVEALRELGVPAVLGVEAAIARLSGSARARLDGERGLVQPLERVEPP